MSSVLLFFISVWLSLKFKIAPVVVQRLWFAFWLVVCFATTGALSFLVDLTRKIGVPFKVTSSISAAISNWTFWLVAGPLQPHIRIQVDESKQRWSEIPNRSMLAVNHTSFYDSFVMVGNAPTSYIHNCRTMMTATLRNLPLLGPVFDRVGHFPVYFKSSEDHRFDIDKERQAPVMEEIGAFLDNDHGRLAYYPEAVVNRKPKEGLSPFRRGMFHTVLEKKLPLYFLCISGSYESWPAAPPHGKFDSWLGSDAIGGYGADIRCSVHKFEVDYEKDDAVSLAERMQKVMQVEFNRLEQIREQKLL